MKLMNYLSKSRVIVNCTSSPISHQQVPLCSFSLGLNVCLTHTQFLLATAQQSKTAFHGIWIYHM